MNFDPVNHPKHYVTQSVMLEPIDVLRYAPFDLGNALKYLIRAGHKDDALQDLKKAEYYINCALSTYEELEANTVSFDVYTTFFSQHRRALNKFDACPKLTFTEGTLYSLCQIKNCIQSRINALEKEN